VVWPAAVTVKVVDFAPAVALLAGVVLKVIVAGAAFVTLALVGDLVMVWRATATGAVTVMAIVPESPTLDATNVVDVAMLFAIVPSDCDVGVTHNLAAAADEVRVTPTASELVALAPVTASDPV
jgi:hypothetical protein